MIAHYETPGNRICNHKSTTEMGFGKGEGKCEVSGQCCKNHNQAPETHKKPTTTIAYSFLKTSIKEAFQNCSPFPNINNLNPGLASRFRVLRELTLALHSAKTHIRHGFVMPRPPFKPCPCRCPANSPIPCHVHTHTMPCQPVFLVV